MGGGAAVAGAVKAAGRDFLQAGVPVPGAECPVPSLPAGLVIVAIFWQELGTAGSMLEGRLLGCCAPHDRC